MRTLTRWLTNSGCIAQALSTPTHLPSMRQTMMKAMSQSLRSDLHVVAATERPQHRPPLPKLDILAVDADEEPQMEWEVEDDVKGGRDHWTHRRSQLPVKRKYSIRWTGRCMSTPPKRKHRHERDANQLAFNGSIPTKVAPKPHVTVRVWCVRRCAIKESNQSSPQHLRSKLCESHSVLRVKKTFRVEDPFLVSNADVSRAHFYADAVRDVYVRNAQGARCMWKTTKDDVRILGCCSTVERTLRPGLGGGRIFPRRGFSVPFLP